MNGDSFQSGQWTGFFTYSGQQTRHRMDLHLDFNNGVLSGSGIDYVGKFVIKGRYDVKANEAWWSKDYIGQHSVSYQGFGDGLKQAIWGKWEISARTKGGFLIRPIGAADGNEEVEKKPDVLEISMAVSEQVLVEKSCRAEDIGVLREYADLVVALDRIPDAARVIMHRAKGKTGWQAAFHVLSRLLEIASHPGQVRQVSYLINEFGTLPPTWERKLVRQELQAYARFQDAEGITICVAKQELAVQRQQKQSH